MTLDELARRAKEGDSEALEALARSLSEDLYGLSMRMLSHPQDAEDATQEILVKVITHLGQFRGNSAFRTWVWSIATRHLRDFRKGRRELLVDFSMIEAMIREGDRPDMPGFSTDVDEELLAEEVKIGCTGAMLLALDRDHRLAYVLGDIFGMGSREAAEVLRITPAAYRKRLQRARQRLVAFMRRTCGLLDPEQCCRCRRQIAVNIRHGTVRPDALLFATHPTRSGAPFGGAPERLREADEIERAAAVFRSHPDYAAPETLIGAVRALIASGRYRLLDA